MSGRQSGFHFTVRYLRLARKALAEAKLGDAIGNWGIANCHFGYTVGSTEGIERSLAARLLRHSIGGMGTRIEKAADSRATVDGWRVAEPIGEAFIELTDRYPIPTEVVTDLAAKAAVEIARRFDVREKP